jgi:hypothetical protein
MDSTKFSGNRAIDEEERIVHEWRVEQLVGLGFPSWLADIIAHRIDWHEIAALVEWGCPPRLALDIIR